MTRSAATGWLGDVPPHWTIEQLRRVASIDPSNVDKKSVDGEIQVRLCNYVDVYKNEQISDEMPFMDATASSQQIRKFGLRRHDVLITKDSETPDDIGVPAVVTEEVLNVVCGYHLALIRQLDGRVYGPFLQRALQARPISAHFHSNATGVTRFGLTRMDLGTAPVPLPPFHEQIAIANFLDRETAGIDGLIDRKRRQIELLKIKRQAAITQGVTRGLDLGIALMSPGNSWIGAIPNHWRIAQLRRFARFITSGSRGWAEHYADVGSIFIRIGNLTRDSVRLDLSDVQYVDPPPGSEGERTKVQAGDILFSITAYLGSVAVADQLVTGAYINQHVALVRLRDGLMDPRFVAYAALSDIGQAQLTGQGYGGTKMQLSLDDVKSLWFPVPPLIEQRDIAIRLDLSLERVDKLIRAIESSIDVLAKRRQALIDSAVTGRIKVAA